ncbi:MAG: hypothetical protein RL172_448 [Bacteroidota bacterium]
MSARLITRHNIQNFMQVKKLFTALACCFYSMHASAQTTTAVPSQQQLAWHELEYYWFIHFGPNTFTNKEWGHGDEPADAFNPTAMDCRQWARIARQSGAKGIIITAKHHDGFSLWPSQYSAHTVRQSKWLDGKGDVLKQLQQACKEYGLLFGVYLSPWDRNHPQYGTPAYNQVYINTMQELVKNYGPFFEFWWDGANGEGPGGKKQVYDFAAFEQTIRSIAPNTVVFSDIGPDIRWVGNEKGIAGTSNWNYLDTAGFKRGEGAPPNDTLNQGNINGKHWIPAECDVSIRPGWFYHAEEDTLVKSPQTLFQLYLKSVGRGANLLLNIPPDRRGLIHSADSAALVGFEKLRRESFSNNFALQCKPMLHSNNTSTTAPALTDGNLQTSVTMSHYPRQYCQLNFAKPMPVNCVSLSEAIAGGQQVIQGKLLLLSQNKTIKEIPFTTIGRKRILTFGTQNITALRLVITSAKATPVISEVAAYHINDQLTEQ